MWNSFFLVFIYLMFQLISTVMVRGAFTLYQHLHKDLVVANFGLGEVLASLILSMLLMLLFMLWRKLIPLDKQSWSIPKPKANYLFWLLIAIFSSIFLLDFLMYYLDFLPDLMEQTFDEILSSFWGIISISLLGPLVEELIFRSGVTRILLKNYSPKLAIILSALIFGLIHMNPVQIIGGFILGLLLAWVYYKTKSIMPSLIIHVINNSLSITLTKLYHNTETLRDLFSTPFYWATVLISIGLLIISTQQLNQVTNSPFKQERE